MKQITQTGTTVENAISEALKKLQATREEVNSRIIQEEKKGFFGFGAKPAEVEVEVKEKLAELGYHPAFGARPLRRSIQEHLEDSIADFILEDPDTVELKAVIENEEIIITCICNAWCSFYTARSGRN